MRNRRAALDGLGRILDAGGLEELFTGPDDEAAFLYDLLVDVARGRSSSCYWEICRTARRRGVTPEFVTDRAVVLLTSMEERRRTDLYRILGSAPLASPEGLRQRWLEFAKTGHPDVGGDPGRFRQVKEAYEILRDPDRRSEYERFWVRALGPFERVAPTEDALPEAQPRQLMPPIPNERRVVLVVKKSAPASAAPTPPPAPEEPRPDGSRAALHAAARLFAARDVLDRRIQPVGDGVHGGLTALLSRVEDALAPVSLDELARLRAEVDAGIGRLEALRSELAILGSLKQRFESLPERVPVMRHAHRPIVETVDAAPAAPLL
ncbi:MAG TPA: J domain-containing protein [Candidatus Binatia bacterium]|nr:J domain-containing protein [Candidatus Binatia bacterium]